MEDKHQADVENLKLVLIGKTGSRKSATVQVTITSSPRRRWSAPLSAPMLLIVVALLSYVPAGRGCLQCDHRIRLLHEDFLLSAASVADQIELKMIIDYAYVMYRETSQRHSGVIDPTTLYRASTEYQSEFVRFLNTHHTGPATFEAIQIMEKGRKILEKHLNTFIHEGLCPNKCGLLYQRVMDCFSCQYKLQTCPSPSHQQDCGVHPVHAEEGGQAVLDCFLPWHSLVLGRPEYHYSWSPGLSRIKKLAEIDFRVLVVTEDSSVVLNQLRVDEQGTYRCSLQDRNGTVFSRVTFLLNVTSRPVQTLRPILTLPSLPPGYDTPPVRSPKHLLLSIIAVVTALSLTASIGLTVVLGLKIKQQRGMEEVKRGKTEENHTESRV